MKRVWDVILTVAIGAVILELYWAYRPDDLTGEIHEWLDTARGRFESWYAERQRGGPLSPEPADATADSDSDRTGPDWLYHEWGTTEGGGV